LKTLIYALGGGWGHLTRAAALARAMGFPTILSNSPYLQSVRHAMPELSIESVASREDAVARIASEDPDVLIVDTFPRGLGGELADLLPSLCATKVLVHRVLNPDYVAWGNLHRFVADHYDCVLCPGERGEFAGLPQAVDTAPWLVREPVSIDARADVVICASGNAEELPWYGEVAALLSRDVDVRCIAAQLPPACPSEIWIRHWPSIDWIVNAKAVVGGAGYNTVNECVALGVPLIARPWPRKYDRQEWRAAPHPDIAVVTTPQEARRAALEVLRRPAQPRPIFRNGANDAAMWVRSIFEQKQIAT
jgi:predicted glycosyltransferase